MPLSFDAARLKAGNKEKPYVPLSERANSGNSGLLANLPGSFTATTAAEAAQGRTSAPPKAVDAPTKGNNNLFTGLADALNKYQKDQEKQHPGYVADEYVFAFEPASIGAAEVKAPPTKVTLKNTAGKKITTAADKTVAATDSVNINS